MFEATRFEYFFSGAAIYDFTMRNNDIVTTQVTPSGLEQADRYVNGLSIRGYGERSALEVLEGHSEIHPERKMLLLYEDKDVRKRNFIIPETRRLSRLATSCGRSRRRISSAPRTRCSPKPRRTDRTSSGTSGRPPNGHPSKRSKITSTK